MKEIAMDKPTKSIEPKPRLDVHEDNASGLDSLKLGDKVHFVGHGLVVSGDIGNRYDDSEKKKKKYQIEVHKVEVMPHKMKSNSEGEDKTDGKFPFKAFIKGKK